MKGIIFTVFSDMIEEKHGLLTLDNLIQQVNPPNKGSYTAGATYSDSELMKWVLAASEMLKIPPAEMFKQFGEYMFPVLAKKYPFFLSSSMTLKEFLKTVHGIIHVEVKKLEPDASLPTITYEDNGGNMLILKYQSPRKLCALAEGLILGAAKHFNKRVNIKQPICMLQDATKDYCQIEVEFLE